MLNNKIAVIGGGNIGTLIAAELSCKKEVTVYSSRANDWSDKIKVFNADDTLLFESSELKVVNDLKQAVSGAGLIFVTVPAFMFEDIAGDIKDYITDKQVLCVIPGSGCAEFAFKPLIDKGVRIIGFQRVHCIARLKEYGKSVYALGRKNRIEIASIPSAKVDDFCGEFSQLFSMPCVSLNNYLCLTLTPSNPILHTSRLYSLFKDFRGEGYCRNPLFYEDWNDDSSRILLEMDSELQTLCNQIPLDLREVVSLKTYYESYTVEEMTNKIRSIKAFKGIVSPMIQQNGRYYPDFKSRYFISDFDFGLKIICDLAKLFDTNCDMLKTVYDWYANLTDIKRKTFELKLGVDELLDIYK